MARSPILRTERLDIEPFSKKHLSAEYVGWLNDRDTMRYSEQRHRRHTLESSQAYSATFEGSPSFLWALCVRDDPLGHIGNMNAHVDLANSIADLGILVGKKEAQLRGFGLEAWLAAIDYLFHEMNLRKITAGTMAANIGMRRVMEKAGMKPDGCRSRHFLSGDTEVDLNHMAVFREEWSTQAAKFYDR